MGTLESLAAVVRLGPLRVSGYGLWAAVGLVGALWLSLRTARLVEIEPVDAWDAGMFGLGAAFVVSRSLLVVGDWQAFRHYPMLILALPSFTYLGMGMTVVAVLVYLRMKRLGVLKMMDVWAPCGALVGAALCVGHWVEGTDRGMPWRRGLVPVQAMGALAALGLAGVLWWMLERFTPGAKALASGREGKTKIEGLLYQEAKSLTHPGLGRAEGGFVGGVGLIAGGLLVFILDLLTQPEVAASAGWLEIGQWIALGAMIVGAAVVNAAKEYV